MMKGLLLTLLCFLSLSAESTTLSKVAVVNLVKRHFPDILIQQEKITQAKAKVYSARGAFDPTLEGKFNSVPLGGYENNYFEGRLNLPIENTANSINAGYRLGRGDWPVYYQNYLTNAGGDTFIGINIPLARNRLIDKVRQNILNNEMLTQSERLMLAVKRNEVITAAVHSFYDWLKAKQRVEIARKLLDIAQKRQQAINQQARLGDIANIFQIENSRLIMQRQSVLVAEQQHYVNAKNKLVFYTGTNASLGKKIASDRVSAPKLHQVTNNWQKNKVPLANVTKFQPYLKFLDVKIKQRFLAIRQSVNEMKPVLDLALFVDKQHGGGNVKLSETSVNLGLNYKLPLRLRKAQGQIIANKSLIRTHAYQKKLFMRQLNLTYKQLMTDINAFIALYQFRRKELTFAMQLEKAERQKFTAGDSSLFLVNMREQTVASTRFLVIDALVSYYQRMNLLESMCFYKKACFRI